MNANELADELENTYPFVGVMEIAATMLRQQQAELDAFKLQYYNIGYSIQLRDKDETIRQQQAEIEALKQIIDANNLNQNIGQFVKPTNEPVAWMHQNPEYPISKHWSQEYNIPLYTHSAKTITDEEIRHIQAQCHLKNVGYDNFIMRFARAILRKAGEK